MTERNCMEKSLLADLSAEIDSGAVEILEDQHPYFIQLTEAFPILCWRIDWRQVPNMQCLYAETEKIDSGIQPIWAPAALNKFWQEVRTQHGIAGQTPVLVLSDGCFDFALKMSVDVFTNRLVDLLYFPKHTYVVPEDYAWCFNETMEGDAFFGMRPEPENRSSHQQAD